MAFQIIAVAPHAAYAEVTETEVAPENVEQQIITETDEATEDDSPQLRATNGGKTVLAFTSDIHNGTASGGETNVGNNRLSTWLSKVQPMYNNSIEVFGFCGDMAAASSNASTFWTFTKTVMDNIDDHGLTGVYAVGNHEYMNGSFDSTSNSPEVRGKYKLNAEARAVSGENYVIYCLGTNSGHGSSWAYDNSQITELTDYLDSVSNDKVIIILTHFPLHDYGSHRTSNTLPVLNALNDAALGDDGKYGTSDDKKIVFLWGHNHSEGDTNYDEVWQPEDQINNSNSSTVYFFYAAAGSMADAEYGSSGRIKGKGLVLEIDGDNNNRLSFSYYDANGNNVTEPDSQTITEASHEPVAIEGVSITNSNPTVGVGRTLKLKYATTPSDATVDSVSWSSNKESVATVDNSGKVTGVAEGEATITLTISDGLSKAVKTTSTVVTVTAASPSEEHTVSITPSTSNPEQSIEIAVGDTLVINTTNGSSSSTYTFTATLSKSGVAEFQGSSSASIAAGSSAAFTVEGVADGTVDITIQNNSSYGSQYVRKAIIHLTVGDGSTPVDPPTGDAVSITPTTSNPEVSATINVDDTLTINVTNSSTSNAYNYSLTFSKTGIAEVQGSSTVNIAAGETGQFTVKGVADGKVDINIQNDQSSSSYIRKGVVHLTVGDGSSTPQTGDTLSITPSTDNPEENAEINVGDTLTIDVNNGSTSSAYDFNATLSNSGIAQLGNTTVNITAGGTGQFTVTGLAAGTVDITIQNENSYGSQYTRKGIIHLTVKEALDVPVTGISLNKSTLSLSTGESATLTATLTPANSSHKTVNWSSSAPAVATVSNGVVTALTAGTTTITATSVDGPSADCTVTVTAVETVTYTLTDKFEDGKEYIIANGNSGSVYVISDTSTGSSTSTGLVGIAASVVNNSITLTAANATKAAFTAELKTSDSNTVSAWLKHGSNYLYTASSGGLRISNEQTTNSGSTNNTGKFWHYKADGKDLLWYFKDGSSNDGYSDTGSTYRYYINCSDTGTFTYGYVGSGSSLSSTNTPKMYIYVKNDGPEVPAESISLNKTALSLTAGETAELVATVLPDNTTNSTVTWSSSNTDVVRVDNGIVTAVAAGSATVTASTSNGLKATCSVTVKAAPSVTYTLTDKFEDGKEYIIANGNSGSVYVISDTSTGSGDNAGLAGISASVANDTITLTATDAAKAVFTAELKTSDSGSVSVWLKHDGNYLYTASSGGLRIGNEQTSSGNTGKYWHYKADGKDLLWFFKDASSNDGYSDTGSTYRYYLKYSSSGTFTSDHVASGSSLSGTDTPKMYIYVKSEQQSGGGDCTIAVTADKQEVLPGETITFTVTLLGPVSNFGSMMMELDIPDDLSYVSGSGKLADGLLTTLGFNLDGEAYFDEDTLMITGYGTKNYSSQDDTVLATFDCTVDNDFSGPATVTLKELEVGDVEAWELLDATVMGVEISLHEHDWAAPVWNWTGSDEEGWTAATATITCRTDTSHTQTVNADVVKTTPESGANAGYTVYTATVTAANSPDGVEHTDVKKVTITYTITYDLDGGILATANPATYTVESSSITLNNPTKTGCTFMGWTGTDLGAATTSVTIATGSTGNRSYTATWRVDGYEVSGNITSYVGLNDDIPTYTYTEGRVEVVLYVHGTDTVVKEATVSEDNKTYTLTGVENGTYDLKVTKKDHAPRTYEITVSNGAVTLDVEIRLLGDMNGDGKLTTFDAGRINSHVMGVRPLTGYDLVVADVWGAQSGPDGNVSTADAGRVNSHAMTGKLLW